MVTLAMVALPIYALVLGVAAISKSMSVNSFETSINRLLGSASLSRTIARVVIAVEFGVAFVALVFVPNAWTIGSMAACWLAFSAVAIWIRVKDRTIECSCFGNLMKREVTSKTVAFNCISFSFLMILAIGFWDVDTEWRTWWAKLRVTDSAPSLLGIVAVSIGLINSLLLGITIAFLRNVIKELKGVDGMDATSVAVHQACTQMSESEKFEELWDFLHSNRKAELRLSPVLFTSPNCQFCGQLNENLSEAITNGIRVLPFIELAVDSVVDHRELDESHSPAMKAVGAKWPKWTLPDDMVGIYDISIPVFPLLMTVGTESSEIRCVAGAEDIWSTLVSDTRP